MVPKQIRKYTENLTANQWVLIIIAALPLITIPANLGTSKIIRWAILVTVASYIATMFVCSLKKRQPLRPPSSTVGILLTAALALLMVISTLGGVESWSVKLIGWDMELLGLASWLSFIVLAVALRKDVTKTLLSPMLMFVVGLVITVSMLISLPYFIDGFRAQGLLFQATSFALYACVGLVIATWQLLYGKPDRATQLSAVAVATLSFLAIIFCQSRAGQAAALVVLLVYMISVVKKSYVKTYALLGVMVGLILIPLLFSSYFMRFQGEQLVSGVAYRLDIYKLSAEEVVSKHPLLGLGAGGIPENINSRETVSYGILETLDRGYIFLSAHDIFLDMALMFGLVVATIFLLFILRACYLLLIIDTTPERLLITGVFIVLLINGLLNTPSLELTSLLFIVLGAVLSLKNIETKRSK